MVLIPRFILLGLLLGNALAWAPDAYAATRPAGGNPSLDSLLAEIRAGLIVDQEYAPGAKRELVLELNQSARLKFEENQAGLTEVLFRYQADGFHVLFGYTGEPHCSNVLTTARPSDKRITCSHEAPGRMQCVTEWQPEDGKGRVVFQATPMSAAELTEIMTRDRRQRLNRLRQVLEWDQTADEKPIRMIVPGPNDPDLTELRTRYHLENVVAGANSDYERLQKLLKWVHDRWGHSGDNTPSKSDPLTILAEATGGKKFRCVEYSIVLAGCAQSLGMPARVLGLKRKDVQTASSGAGHVVTEVWLAPHNKWVMADGQWDAIPVKGGLPLSAVEFQHAFATSDPGLTIRSSSTIDADNYLAWVVPYLYYFDFNIDQHLFGQRTDHADNTQRYQPKGGKIMLVPKGAPNPTVFQQKIPIKNCTYISNPKAFYAPPVSTP